MTEKVTIVSPVDGRVYAERPITSDGEVAAAIARARAAQAEWKRVAVAERGRLCLAALEALSAMNEEIAPELAWQMGRPVRFGGEKRGVEERMRYMVGIAEAALAPYVPEPKAGFRRHVAREPVGLVLVIAPWNYPYLTAVNTIVPALVAGNSVLLKHAAQTLLVGERFQRAFNEAGLSRGVFQNLVLGHGQTERLIASGAVNHVNFTGSVAGGRAIARAAAGTFSGVGLELGGKDPAYVRADADFDGAVENLVDGAFFNSGQSCCGVERIYVHGSLYDRFVEGYADLTRQYVVGNPLEPATTLGPMARPAFADNVRGHVEEARRKGATALIDMTVENDRPGSPYIAPQVLTNVDHQMAVMCEESFGPVVGIMKVRDDEEAIGLMNDSPYGLTASIWTSDVEAVEVLGRRLETGTVFMNRCDYLDPALVWTGVKQSGRGAALSKYGYDAVTRPKSFHLREVG